MLQFILPNNPGDQAEACLQWGRRPILASSLPDPAPSIPLLPIPAFNKLCAFEFLFQGLLLGIPA